MADADAPPRHALPVNRPQLLTYPDSLGGTISDVTALLRGPLDGAFSSVHILPPYPSTGDRGFAPVTYEQIDPAFGSWTDVEDLARTHGTVTLLFAARDPEVNQAAVLRDYLRQALEGGHRRS